MTMDNTQMAASLEALVPEASIAQGKQYVEVTVAPGNLKAIIEKLRNEKDLFFDMLVCLTGMDWGEDLGVIYHLRSTSYNHMVVVKTRIPDREHPAVDSICDIYPGAEYHEREAYDLLGISFNGHPDLRRLFLDSTWGFPLRKDYKDDVNIVSK